MFTKTLSYLCLLLQQQIRAVMRMTMMMIQRTPAAIASPIVKSETHIRTTLQ